eukprot:2490248-Rhodomonas_salina.1
MCDPGVNPLEHGTEKCTLCVNSVKLLPSSNGSLVTPGSRNGDLNAARRVRALIRREYGCLSWKESKIRTSLTGTNT